MLKRAIIVFSIFLIIPSLPSFSLASGNNINSNAKSSKTNTSIQSKTGAASTSNSPNQTENNTTKKPIFTDTNLLHSSASNTFLKGSIIETVKASPLLYGNVQTVPKGTKLTLSIMGNLNSQISKIGDDIFARVVLDVNNGGKVMLPGGWYMHGTVTDIAGQKRLGRDGYVTVEFDKLVSPDGDIDLPFNTKFSTKDNQLKAISKTVLIDSGYVSVGAIGGSILSVQLTGLPVAIATHGISVGAGAAVGGGLGLIGALKRKGKIASFFPGDEMTITTAEPIELPGFDARFIPSAEKPNALPNLDMTANHYVFSKDPFGDKLSKLLSITITIHNDTDKEISLFDLAVLSDHGQRYFPSLTIAGLEILKNKARLS